VNAKPSAQELELARDFQAPLVHREPPTSMLDIIDRASRDPTVDVDKLAKLLEMSERVQAREAKTAYTIDFAKMKPLLPVIGRNGLIEVREKTNSGKRDGDITQSTPFARWEDIDEAITPILAAHGFVLSFRPGMAGDGKITMTAILSHSQGHSEEATVTLPHDSSGSKNPVQAVGSSLSYGKRYSATSILNIRTKGEDDDGKMAGADDEITEADFEHLQHGIERTGSDIEKLCKYFKIDALKNMKRKDYPTAMEMLNAKPTVKK
jgi:ERF superfamily